MPRFDATHSIQGLAIDLEPGQSWDDIVTLTMTREQAMVAMTACSAMLTNVLQGLEDAAASANAGDMMAILVGPHLASSARDLQSAMRTMAETLLPALIAEVDAADAAKQEQAH